jgi:CRP-like cAMP-binding protein
MQPTESVREALRRFPLFAHFPEEQLQWFVAQTLQQRYRRGEVIFNRGDQGDRAFVILTGAVDLVVESPDGRELILARLGPGEHFGEMALVDGGSRSAAARAASRSELVVVLRDTLMRALSEEPDLSWHIIRSLVQRLRVADEKLEAFAYLDAEGRMARALLDVAGAATDVRASHEELSHMAAISRQTATRILGEWEQAGYVALARRGITLTDRPALVAMAQL